MLPQLAATGLAPEPAAVALTTVTATFAPVSAGRAVSLEVKDGKRWVLQASGVQDAGGRVLFNAPYAWRGAPATYRVVAPKAGATAQIVSSSVRTDAWGAPIFSDEFSGTALAAPWDHRYQGYEVPSRRCSKTDPRATAVGGGVLSLSVIDDPDRADPCTFTTNQGVEQSTFYRLNGHVGTQGRFQYKYGVAAARIKFQELRGQHGAFWMQAPVPESGAEIDVIEWFGTGSSGLSSGVWTYGGGTQTKVAETPPGDDAAYGSDWAGTYHVFSVEWTPTEYVFRIDGKETLRTSAGVSQTEEYLILSLLVSNFESLRVTSPDQLPADHVRRLGAGLAEVGQGDSRTRVIGPSLTLATRMSAPKRPRSTCAPSRSSSEHTASYSGSLTGPGAAASQVGRRPLRASPYSVNWLTTSTGAATSLALCSSRSSRRSQIFRAVQETSGVPSLVGDAEVDEEARSVERADHLAVDRDAGGEDPLDDGAHGARMPPCLTRC